MTIHDKLFNLQGKTGFIMRNNKKWEKIGIEKVENGKLIFIDKDGLDLQKKIEKSHTHTIDISTIIDVKEKGSSKRIL